METGCLYFSIVLSQHRTACSGRDSWSPHCELSSQLRQKVWSPENMRAEILAAHMKWKWMFNEAGAKSHSLFLIFKGAWDERHKYFYLMGTFFYISDLNMNKLISHHSQKLKLTRWGGGVGGGRKWPEIYRVLTNSSPCDIFAGSCSSRREDAFGNQFLWTGEVLALYLYFQLPLTCCFYAVPFI